MLWSSCREYCLLVLSGSQVQCLVGLNWWCLCRRETGRPGSMAGLDGGVLTMLGKGGDTGLY